MSRGDKAFWAVGVVFLFGVLLAILEIVVTAAWWTGRCSTTVCPDGSKGLARGEKCTCVIPATEPRP